MLAGRGTSSSLTAGALIGLACRVRRRRASSRNVVVTLGTAALAHIPLVLAADALDLALKVILTRKLERVGGVGKRGVGGCSKVRRVLMERVDSWW